jgi:membrane fusion protein
MSAANESLFRTEALEHQSAHLYGRVKLLMPVRYAVAAAVSLALAASTVAFGYAGQYTKKARVAGVLMPRAGVAKLTAVAGGVVLERLVREGQTVAAGQALFVLSGERESEQGETAKLIAQQIDARRGTLEAEGRATVAQLSIRASALLERAAALDRERSQLQGEIELQARRVALARLSLARQEDLAAKGFVPPAQVQTKQEEWMEQQARLQTLERSATALAREGDGIAAQRAELAAQVRGAKEQTTRSLSTLKQEHVENAARRRTVITAPHAGSITAIAAEPGMAVPAGSALATLLPQDATLEAQLYAPGSAVGFVEVGQRVQLRYEAYPYQKFGMATGTVQDVTKSPFALNELPAAIASTFAPMAQATGGAVYRLTVALDSQTINAYGSAQSLKPGMNVEADVIQDRRRLYEWVFEPIIGFAGKAAH